jgi:hypothetical protein
MAHPQLQQVESCPSCDARLTGPFCHQCGESRPDPHDFSWKHAGHDAIHEFLHLDGKIVQTLWLLIRRPGFLTAEYWQGRRRIYIRPLRLYIVLAAIHLLAMSSSYYRVDFFLQNEGAAPLRRLISRIAEKSHTTPEAARERINEKLAKTYSVTQYCAVLGFAVVPWAIYRRRRPHYLQHAIFALHVYGFYFLLTSMVSQFLTAAQWQRSPLPLVTLAYLYFAVRRLYGEARWIAFGKAVVLRLGLFAAEFLALGIALAAALALLARG